MTAKDVAGEGSLGGEDFTIDSGIISLRERAKLNGALKDMRRIHTSAALPLASAFSICADYVYDMLNALKTLI